VSRYLYVGDLYPRTDPVGGTRLVRFSLGQAYEVREDANGPGMGRMVIRGDSADAQFIEAPAPGKVGAQYVRQVRIDTATVDGATLSGFAEKVVGGFFLDKGDFEALSERSTRKLTFGGAGPEAILERVVMANVTYVSGAEGPFDGEWHWYFSDPGEILHRAIQEANEASRPQSPIPGVTVDFTQLVDSDGNAWAGHGATWLFTFPSGRPITELIARLREHGLYVRVDPDTFVVSAWPTAAYRTAHDFTGSAWGAGVIRFMKSPDGNRANGNILDDAKRGVEVYKRRSHLLVGKDDNWEWVAASPLPDVTWEGSFQVDDEEGNAFPSLGAIQLQARDDAGDTARIRFKCQASSPATGQYLPFDDVLPNYLVTAHSGATEWDWNEAEFPVASITLKVRRTGIGDAWVDLGATFREAGQQDASAQPVPHHTHPPNPRLCPRAVDILLGLTDASLKASSENTVDGTLRHDAVDGDPATRWSPASNEGPTVDHWWAADVGAAQEAEAFRYFLSAAGEPDLASAGTVYGSNDAGAWSWLPSGKIAADPTANGWTAVVSWSGLTSAPDGNSDTGLRDFDAASYRYWLVRATAGGVLTTSEFDASTFELWTNPRNGHSVYADRCDHGHSASEIDERRYGNVQAAIDAFYEQPGLPWFNVQTYGAIEDNATDMLASGNLAIAAMNAGGGGRLYFPGRGVGYLASGGFDAITVPGIVMGDGMGATLITCSSGTANLFTSNCSTFAPGFRDMRLVNSAATPTAGAGIRTIGTGNMARYQNLRIESFWTGIRSEDGAAFVMDGLSMNGMRKYCVHISNAGDPDEGDWHIANSIFVASVNSPDAAIRLDSSGGGKITNTKINGHAGNFTNGLEVAISSGDTVILVFADSSIEAVSGDCIDISQSAGATWKHLIFTGNQFGMWNNNTGKAISIVGANAGALSEIVIANNVLHTNGTPRSAIRLTNVDNVGLSGNVLDGFDDLYTATTSTNITEGAAGVTDHGALTGLADDDHTQYLNENRHDALAHAELDDTFTVDPGTATYDDTGDGVDVTVTSKWGITSGGAPYFDPANVASGDEAALVYNPATGQYRLVRYE
jgi:hypothetical protein